MNLFINSLRPSSVKYDAEVIRYIAAAIPEDDATLIIGSMDMKNPPPPALDWQLAAERNVLAASQSGATVNWEVVLNMAHRIDGLDIPIWLDDTIMRVLTHDERSTQLRSLYLGLPADTTYSRSPEGLHIFLRAMAGRYSFDNVIVLTSLALEARYPLEFIDPALQRIGLYSVSSEKFQTANLRVDVYRRVT